MNIADFVIGYEEFKARYLETANNTDNVTRFWNDYNENPHGLIHARQFLLLRDRMFGLLEACKRIDADAFKNIHKGHPFYFIGITSYLLGDFQTGIYFFDAALTEDLKVGAEPKNKPKPSTRFLMLEGDFVGQAAQELVKETQMKVERVLKYYNDELSKDSSIPEFTIEDLRNHFIYPALISNDQGLRTLVTTFITYFIEWDSRNKYFALNVGQGTSEPFFLHLFRGCVLFESLLTRNPEKAPKGKTLIMKINDLRDGYLKLNHIQGKDFSLDDVYAELLANEKSIFAAVKITAMARNTIGHDLGWNEHIDREQYQKLYFKVAASCLHTIACLWIPKLVGP